MTEEDIKRIREQTPNCKDKLFLNSAGASLVPDIVADRVIEYLEEERKIGGYRLEELHENELEEFYSYAAKLLNTNSRNIAFAQNATDAYTKALSSIDFKEGDVIITTDDDYVSNQIQFISLKNKFKVKIKRIKTLENGDLDIQSFEKLIQEKRPVLVAVTHIPTNSGLVQNVEEIANICFNREILFILDACQSVGQIEVDVQKIRCDFLSVPGRKFLRGPRGTGILYVSDRMLALQSAPLFVDLAGADWIENDKFKLVNSARRFQYWETPCALILGLKEAIKYALNVGLKNIEVYNQKLISRLTENLNEIPHIKVLDRGSRKASIITFSVMNKSCDQMCELLHKQNVYFSVARKSSALIDFDKKGVEWAIRFSPHYFNTIDEIDEVVDILKTHNS